MGKRTDPSDLRALDAERVCLIKPSALGDVVQTMPLVPVLRERFPRARLAWVVNRPFGELLEGLPGLDEVIPLDRRGPVWNWLRLLGDLRRRRFDLVFDLQGLLRTAVMAAATGARLRVGLESSREGAGLACHLLLPDSGRLVPAHLRYWRVAEALGLGDRHRQAEIPIPAADREWADGQVATLRGPLLAVHPGARWKTKLWPVEKFAAVAARAFRAFGFSTIIVGGSDERLAAARLEHLLRRFVPAAGVLNLAGRTSLKQLAAVLAAAGVMLSNDSGPMHLAAAMGTPVVGVFTCTSPTRSGPPGPRHALVAAELPCAASYRKRCPHRGRKHLACMEELSIERVWQAFARLVDRRESAARAA
ncbi:MAG TPA: glycosyltransferase family 9 protein [Planctomycetaceae bacterium]|nr:glycosyltransferase family 9 protein [Planctomycetaceae bacterium]